MTHMNDEEFAQHVTSIISNPRHVSWTLACCMVTEAKRARMAERDLAAYVATATKALRTIHELVDAELDAGDGCIKEIAAAALAEAKEGAVVLNEAFHEKDKILEGWVGRAERAERRADAAEAKLKKAEAFEVAYNSISGNGWLQRAHALPGRLGSDVWHNAVERAERLGAAEARAAKLV